MSTVLITGAAAGIGRAAAVLFAARGWNCVLVDRDADRVAGLAESLPAGEGQQHRALSLDLLDPSALSALDHSLDVVINNAGMSDTRGLGLTELPWSQCQPLMALNLQVPLAVVRAVQHCLGPQAQIVNVASGAGFQAIPWRGLYSATKAGLLAQSRALAPEFPGGGVFVLAPGFVRTELVQSLIDSGRLDPVRAVAKIPLGRMAEPEELAHALLFLSSRPARLLGSQPLRVDGGSGVFGGSAAFAPSRVAMLPCEAPTAIRVSGAMPTAAKSESLPASLLAALEAESLRQSSQVPSQVPGQALMATGHYPATIDFSACACAPSDLLGVVHKAAQAFVQQAIAPASLTLVLPPVPAGIDPVAAGSHAAVRMLVGTLACELGTSGLRVNAISVSPGCPPEETVSFIHYVAGARAQFLTGQVFELQPEHGA